MITSSNDHSIPCYARVQSTQPLKSQICRISFFKFAGCLIYPNIAMSSWTKTFDAHSKACKQAILPQTTIQPLACEELDMACGSSGIFCSPGEFCRLKDLTRDNGGITYTIKAGECDRCTPSKLQQTQNHPGASATFNFGGKSYAGSPPLQTVPRCQPFIRDYSLQGTKPHEGPEESQQKHGGVYTCKQNDECVGNLCEEQQEVFAEATRLSSLACPRSNPFVGNGLKVNLLDTQLRKNVKEDAIQTSMDGSYKPAMVILYYAVSYIKVYS